MTNEIVTVGTVKKVSTQASKGGSIVVSLEFPLTEKNASITIWQNKDCAVSLNFESAAIEDAKGQMGFDFGEDESAMDPEKGV